MQYRLCLLVLLVATIGTANGQTHRLRFKYRISYAKSMRLADVGRPISYTPAVVAPSVAPAAVAADKAAGAAAGAAHTAAATTPDERAAAVATADEKAMEATSAVTALTPPVTQRFVVCPPDPYPTGVLRKVAHFLTKKIVHRAPFKCLITPDRANPYKLSVDGWQITANGGGPDSIYIRLGGGKSVAHARLIDTSPADLYVKLPDRKKLGDPTIVQRFHYQTWILAANTLALKVRPKVKNAANQNVSRNVQAGSVNLGLSGGYSFGWTTFTHRTNNSFSLTPSIGLGFSAAALSKEILSDSAGYKANQSNLILSPSASLVIARNDIGLILSYGYDLMVGQYASSWAYQGRPFWGLGISAGFKL